MQDIPSILVWPYVLHMPTKLVCSHLLHKRQATKTVKFYVNFNNLTISSISLTTPILFSRSNYHIRTIISIYNSQIEEACRKPFTHVPERTKKNLNNTNTSRLLYRRPRPDKPFYTGSYCAHIREKGPNPNTLPAVYSPKGKENFFMAAARPEPQ